MNKQDFTGRTTTGECLERQIFTIAAELNSWMAT